MPKSGVLPLYIGRLCKLFDDWNDNALFERSKDYKDAVKCVDLNKYRPIWTIKSGSPSVSNGLLTLPIGDTTSQQVSATSGETVGTWEIKFTVPSATAVGFYFFSFIWADNNNKLDVYARYNADYKLQKVDAGTGTALITSTWDDDTSQHTMKVTRDADGNFELFYDGVSKGTATDTFLPTTHDIALENGLDSEVRLDDLKVY